MSNTTGLEIAIVGMACRFPGAADVDDFWRNVRDGVESIRPFSDEELAAAGIPPALLASPRYVKAGAAIAGIEEFDARLFGYSPREAEVIDPQQRLFLECAWTALERAGYDPEQHKGAIGIYAGASMNHYLLNLFSNGESAGAASDLQRFLGNEKDYLTTRVSYKLNLTGPSVAVQTACSSSLVAVHLACQGLLSGECDLALAGGVAVQVPQVAGYFREEGGIFSPSGKCRAFDAEADGTVFGSGLGVVVLKRLEDALRDRDTVHAVIKGSAINNDGSGKVGFTAPAVDGQARVIRAAQLMAEVDPEAIRYVETHGTGTPLGDPIEIEALTRAFRRKTRRTGFCALGSVKANIGHLANAAGVAGLIKAALAIEHGQIPPSLHFLTPNPNIDFASTPFFVNTALSTWPADGGPRAAAVSSFGIGGTNAHVILEQAPERAPSGPSRPLQLLVLSAATPGALGRLSASLGRHLRDTPGVDLADVAYTLALGRRRLSHRRTLVCADRTEAADALQSLDPAKVATTVEEARERRVVFLFPGQGSQYAGMGTDLYPTEPVFRREVDRCAKLLEPALGLDLRTLLFPAEAETAGAAERLDQTRFCQPALFTIEIALARLWSEWGVEPEAMLGHSVGEYVAACLGGVLSLEDALALVAERGRLMQELPRGAMLAVPLGEEAVLPRLSRALALAAVNAPDSTVVSGPEEAVEAFTRELVAQGIEARRLRTSHAFHSAMMDPILEPFAERLRSVELGPFAKPWISNLTGTWITAEQAADPLYWVHHLRSTVRFASGVRTLLSDPQRVYLEVGPGRTLASLLRRPQGPEERATQAIASMRHASEDGSDLRVLLTAAGRLWLAGARLDWRGVHSAQQRGRTSLPTYPFERERFWVERGDLSRLRRPTVVADPAAWFYVPCWKPAAPLLPPGPAEGAARALLVGVEGHLGRALDERLRRDGWDVISVAPGGRERYRALLEQLGAPRLVFHLPAAGDGFLDLLALSQALAPAARSREVRLCVVATGMHEVILGEPVDPLQATRLGPVRVIPWEEPGLVCRCVDVEPPRGSEGWEAVADLLVAEAAAGEPVVAYRCGRRWLPDLEPVRLDAATGAGALRPRGVYLITGGFGGIGSVLARHLAEAAQARLILVGRTALDPVKLNLVGELESLGAEVLPAVADVASADAMAAVLRLAEERFGPVHGVIHAAGVAGGGVFELRSPDAAAMVLAPKVQGALALALALGDRPLDFVLLCSSTIALTGEVGQVDYCAANAFLDAFAQHWPSTRGVRAVSVSWPGWRDVGMAAASRAAGEPFSHPLLDRRLYADVDRAAYGGRLDPSRHWVLAEHRAQGIPVLPGTAYLEMVRASFEDLSDSGSMELRDTVLLAPMVFPGGASRSVQVLFAREGDSHSFLVRSRPDEGDGNWTSHVTGTVFSGVRDIDALEVPEDGAWTEAELGEEPAVAGLVEWGPRWRCSGRVRAGETAVLADLELPSSFAVDLEELGLHPALLDVAMASGLRLVGSGNHLPLSFEQVRIRGRLPGKIRSRVVRRSAGSTQGAVTFDLSIQTVDGDGVLEVRGYTLRRLERAPAGTGAPRATRLTGALSELVEKLVEHEGERSGAGTFGLSPAEGVEAFRRILAWPLGPRVVVSKTGLDFSPPARRARNQVAATEPGHGRPEMSTSYVAPRSELERECARLWQKVLGIREIGIHDNFFDLGGHSLMAIQIVTRVRDAFEVELPLASLFERPTIAELSQRIETARQGGAAAADRIEPVPRGGELPLSFAQLGLWLHSRLEPESPAFLLSTAIRLEGSLDLPALRASFEEIVSRHEVLRSRFVEEAGRPRLVLAPPWEMSMPVVDLAGLPGGGEREVRVLASAEAGRPIDVSRGPLLRTTLLRQDAARHVLFITLHHIAADAWSVGPLIRELIALYGAFRERRSSPLPPLAIQYADYAAWQQRRLQGEALEALLDYWRGQIGSTQPRLQLPTRGSRSGVKVARGMNYRLQLSPHLSEGLRALGRGEGTTLFMTLLAAFQALLFHYSGEDEIRVGTRIAGRSHAATEDLIGCFINTLVLCGDLAGDPPFRHLLRRTRETVLDAYAHQELPFERLVEGLRPDRDLRRAPLFQVLFNFQNAPGEEVTLPGLSLRALEEEPMVPLFDLYLEMTDRQDSIAGFFNYSSDLFSPETIAQMGERFERLLEEVAASPDLRLSELGRDLDTGEEALVGFNEDLGGEW